MNIGMCLATVVPLQLASAKLPKGSSCHGGCVSRHLTTEYLLVNMVSTNYRVNLTPSHMQHTQRDTYTVYEQSCDAKPAPGFTNFIIANITAGWKN